MSIKVLSRNGHYIVLGTLLVKCYQKFSITVKWLTFTPMNSIFKKHFQKFLNRFVYKCRRECLIVRVRRHIWCILSFIIHDKNYIIAYYQCDYMLFTVVYQGRPWYLELFLLQICWWQNFSG